MSKLKSKLLFLLIPICLVFSCKQSQSQLISEELKSNITERVKRGEFPGVAMAVFNAEDTEYFNYGLAQVGEDAEVNENTLFEIGSISKTFTAILLAKMVQSSDMSLDDPIGKYLPDTVTVPSRNGLSIQLKHLVTHTSGLSRMPDNFFPEDPMNPFADYTYEALYDFIDRYELGRDPGYDFLYSNVGMGLMGHLLERHTGKDYELLLKENITGPLGMDDTAISLNENLQSRFATGHRGVVTVSEWNIVTLAGAGGIRSTTTDMVKYIKANMGLIDTDLRNAMDLSHRPLVTSVERKMPHAMAWIYGGDTQDILWHNGGTGGFRTFAGFNKKSGIGVVLLTNSNLGADDIGFHLLDPSMPLKGQ